SVSVPLLLRSLVQAEGCALGIHQLGDAAAAGHLDWSVHNGCAFFGRTGKGGVEIGNLRVVKPHWRHWRAFGYSHHAAQLPFSDSEDTVASHGSHIHVLNNLPSKKLRIEVEGGRMIARHQFVPAKFAGLGHIVQSHGRTWSEDR